MKKSPALRKFEGFTLIELLVVIAIIGTLSALFLPNFMSARERARDSQRKSDLRQIQKAIELYKQDQVDSSVPVQLPAKNTCWSSEANCTGNIYMNKFPADPNRSAALRDEYFYSPGTDLITYTLCACLENKADPDGVTANCETGNYDCVSGKSYVVNQP